MIAKISLGEFQAKLKEKSSIRHVQVRSHTKERNIIALMNTATVARIAICKYLNQEKKSKLQILQNKESDIFDPEPYSTEFPPAEVKYAKLSKRKKRRPLLFDKKRYRDRVTSRYNRFQKPAKDRICRWKKSRYKKKSRHHHLQRFSRKKNRFELKCKSKKCIQTTPNVVKYKIDEFSLAYIDPVPYSTSASALKCVDKVPKIVKKPHKKKSEVKLEVQSVKEEWSDENILIKPPISSELSHTAEDNINDSKVTDENNPTQISNKTEPEKLNVKIIDKFDSISECNESLEDTQNEEEIKITDSVETPKTDQQKYDNFVLDKFIYSFSKSSDENSDEIDIDNTANSLSGEDEEEEDSDEEDINHFNVEKGFIIKDYKILKTLGEGTFGRVFQCQKLGSARLYALKIIRPKQKYIEAAKYEVEILKEIKEKVNEIKKDNKDFRNNCIELHNSFKFVSPFNETETHVCLVFESLGKSLFEFIKENHYRGFQVSQIMQFAKQMFQALDFLHSMEIVHTDIKPENILFQRDVIKKVSKTKDFPDQIFLKSRVYREMLKGELNEELIISPYLVSEESKIKLIDFGGAIKLNESRGRIINTRQYRSPEVILGCCEWNEKSDIWSLACVLFELYTGEMLFPTHDDFEHLAMIEKLLGPIDEWMVDHAGIVADGEEEEYWKDAFTKTIKLSGISKWEGRVRWDKLKERVEEESYIEIVPLIEEVILPEHNIFLDLIKYTLVIDPSKRPTANKILSMFFLN